MDNKRIIIVHPHGFCSGVARAIAAAETALEHHGAPIYGLHEIVHNEQVTGGLVARGLHVVERLADVPPGAVVLLSAHGVAPAVRTEARARNLRLIDATCPFVAKVHREVLRFVADGCTVVCIGHRTHAEVVGIAGEAPDRVVVVESLAEARAVQPPDPDRVAVVSQTTLSPETADSIRALLRERFPRLRQPPREDICYATRNRQQAVRTLAQQADQVLVLGSANSSNTRRLVETAQQAGGRAHLVGSCADLARIPIEEARVLGIASGASTPESFITEVLSALAGRGFTAVEQLHAVAEHSHVFRPPVLDAAHETCYT
jgi:4-hydroxy-3-methylbut-2-enyl diphosphate reductase